MTTLGKAFCPHAVAYDCPSCLAAGVTLDPRPAVTLHTCWDNHEGPDGTHLDGSPCLDKATPLYPQPAPRCGVCDAPESDLYHGPEPCILCPHASPHHPFTAPVLVPAGLVEAATNLATAVTEAVTAPRTEAGRALLEAFTTPADSPDFAIRISEESVIRHAIPRIEAEARAAVLAEMRERVEGLPGYIDQHGAGRLVEYVVLRAAVLAVMAR